VERISLFTPHVSQLFLQRGAWKPVKNGFFVLLSVVILTKIKSLLSRYENGVVLLFSVGERGDGAFDLLCGV
jgi:hypothetical protein